MASAALPIDPLLPQIAAAVAAPGATLLLQAPPGAGKTTRVPLTVMEALASRGSSGRVWMLEPRRLAARQAAQRIASDTGEALGQRVGYSVRLESRISAATRLEVITEGLFLRRLQADPALEGVDAVLFDEFHERNADADLALALLRQARILLRPELRLVVMSATLALEPLRQQLPDAQVLCSEGRSHPVAISHQPPRPDERLERQVVRGLEQHWLEQHGPGETALVFLPGLREIQACERAISDCPWSDGQEIAVLHGNLPLPEQARLAAPAAVRNGTGQPQGRVVLATSIAESSLTIPGVTLVIDAGLSRRNRYDPARGLDALVTVPASRASAEQRAGRAGRLGPGRCLRLWSPAEQQRRPSHDPPELLEADPLPLALQLARWGDPLGEELEWIDPPPAAGLTEARSTLQRLGALEPGQHGGTGGGSTKGGQLNRHGQAMAELGTHPRLAHLLLEGRSRRLLPLACDLAALLGERDPLNRQEVGCNLLHRLDWLRRQPERQPLRQLSRQWQRQLQASNGREATPEGQAPSPPQELPDDLAAALLLAAAYPERLALQRPGQPGRYQLRSGRGALLPPQDPLAGAEALAVAALDDGGRDGRIQLALALPQATLQQLAEQEGEQDLVARWDEGAQRVRCERQLRLGALLLETRPWPEAPAQAIQAALLGGVRERGLAGLASLGWTDSSRQLQHRLSLAHRHRGQPWPDRHDALLLNSLEDWLAPHLGDERSLAELAALDLQEALWGELSWAERQELERLLPGRLLVPSGRWVSVDYSSGEPVLAAKLQELFGCRQTPTVLDGQLPVTLHLLTPAGRPAAITRDLAGFWQGSYREVRRELRGRYPKHPWPEDGANAEPTALTKARLPRG
jgi:ATP-dependent helicase HrpB